VPRRTAARRPREISTLTNEVEASKLRAVGVLVVCAKVFLVPIVFDPGADFPFTVPKALLSHGLAYVLAGVLIALFVRYGARFFVRSWLHVPVLAFLFANTLATVFAADKFLALYGAHGRMLGLGTIADWVVLYFAIVLLVRTRREAIAVLATGLAASVPALAYEAIQLLGKDPFSWNMNVTLRPFGTLGQPTTLSEYLTILAVGSLAIALVVRRLPMPIRGLLILHAAVLLAGTGATATRSPVVGLAAGTGVLVVLIWALHPSRRARVISLSVAGMAALGLVSLILLTPLGTRLAATVAPAPTDDVGEDVLARFEPSVDTRLVLYLIALNMVQERPVLGYGPDNFTVGVPKYRAENSPSDVRQSLATSPHSWVAQVGTSSGLLGLGSFIAVAIVALLLTMRAGFHPLAVAGIAMIAAILGTGLTTVSDVGTDWLFWASTGMVAAATASSVDSRGVPLSRAGRRIVRGSASASAGRVALAVVSVTIGLGLAASAAAAFDASRSIRSAELARVARRATEAIQLADRATRADPGRSEYWQGLGLAYIGANRLRDAASALENASRLAPHDVRIIADLARVLILLERAGDSTARARALELGEKAVRIDPNNPRANLTRAVVMQVAGNLPEALHSVERALALDPQSQNANLYVTAAQIYTATGRPADGIRIARVGIALIAPPIASVPLRIELARALIAVGQPNDALAEVDAALAIQPNQPSAVQLLDEIQRLLQK
jgi:O-antigen ligase/tetratricopeptide (TPR) repeat protein